MEQQFKLDRNQIIGFVLIGVIMIAFAWWSQQNAPEPESTPQEQSTEEQPLSASPAEPTADIESIDTSAAAFPEPNTDSSEIASADSVYVLENKLIKVHISSRGGLITLVELKQFKTWDEKPLYLVDSNQIMAFRVGEKTSTIAQQFSGEINRVGDEQTLSLLATDENTGATFGMTYSLPDSTYQLGMHVRGNNLPGTQNTLFLDWQLDALRTEKSVKTERQQATIYYWQDDDYHSLSVRGDDDEEETNIKWLGYKQHFFSSILQPATPMARARMAIAEFEGEELTKRMKSQGELAQVGSSFDVPLTLYYGPNKFNILKTFDQGYQNIIDFGWGIFGWIGKGVVIPIFNWLERYDLNYGIIILIMAIILKIVLFPLTYTSYKSMAKMRVLKPEMDELNKKFEGKDAAKKNQAVMELYQQAGVNPLGGCIPVLVQMPILIAMFRFFPASIELRQQKFLWANDLSSYDAIVSWQANIPIISEYFGNHISLFTVLMTISTLIYTWMNSQMQGNTNQIPGMKYIMYGMPIMLLFWFNSYSAGLSYYYFVANIITFSQQFLIRRTIDDDAIHAKLQAKRANPKKKSKFQQRLEDMQKQQGNRRTRR
jgi:YidC/Oxa1 family membrane protein insertase